MRTNTEVGPDGEQVWPTPIRDRVWVDTEGTEWRMRGAIIGRRELHRLARRPDVLFLHAYGVTPTLLTRAEATGLLADIERFHAGDAHAEADFTVADFRDDRHRVLVVVQESC